MQHLTTDNLTDNVNSSSNSLPLPNPDFDSLKSSLKTFLMNQESLKDYDFDGSVLSVILDTLSYNSHLNAFWLNMIGNEAFLKTAIKRNNVVANALDLGYTPSSAKSAHTKLHLEYIPKDKNNIEETILIPAGSTFSASGNVSSYNFNLLDSVVANYDEEKERYIAEDVLVYEGRLLVHEFTVTSEDVLDESSKVSDVTLEGLSLPNLNVDATTLKVYVKDDNLNNDFIRFFEYDKTLNIASDSQVYFVSEDEFGRVNVSFGDGKLGYRPTPGSKIKIVYLISSGPGANRIAKFNQTSGISDVELETIIPLYPSSGGCFSESIDSIKYNAQLGYESQGKAIVTGDYEYMVRKIYPHVKKVITWGGQDAVPPQYGKVFVSIQPKDGIILTTKDKDIIKKYIESKNIATIDTIIIEPDYIYVDLNVYLTCNEMQNISTNSLKNKIVKTIKNYEKNKLQTFDKDLDYSRLLSEIDNTSSYIRSNITELTLYKKLHINEKKREYNLNFGNAIIKQSISSSRFTYNTWTNCYFKLFNDNIAIARIGIDGNEIIVLSNAGSIDENNGIIRLKSLPIIPNENSINYDNYYNAYFIKISAKPKSNNITTLNNQIINIGNINVNYSIK